MADVSKIIKGGLKAIQEAESATAKAARSMGKKSDVVPPPFERAPAKSKEEIDVIARRIAPQITGEFVRLNPKQSVNPAGLSKKRFEIEKELEHDIRPVKEVREPATFDYAANEGKVQLGVFGDPTIAQQDIYEVAGRRLALPSRQYGGPRYPMYEPEDAWASNFGAASGVQSAAERASKQYGGADVLGLYTKMGADSYYYAQHLSDALMKNIMPSLADMSKRDIAGFNKMVRNNPKAKDFAGIENPDISLAQMEKNPEMRKQFAKLATTPTYTEAFNMPNGLDVVHATLEPELRNLERGVTGHSIVELDPSIRELHAADHPTYDTRIPRKADTEVQKLEVPYAYDIQYPDQLLAISKNPKQADQPFGTLMMSGARQIIDPQHIDEVGLYRDFIKKYTGKKKGGAVKMADGGKVFKAALKLLKEAGEETTEAAAYKAKFEPGYWHASPSPDITRFAAPDAQFFTKDRKFADTFIPLEDSWDAEHYKMPKTGSTTYPASLNLGKHFDPTTVVGQQLIKQNLHLLGDIGRVIPTRTLVSSPAKAARAIGMHPDNWEYLENRDFINYLKKSGYDSMAVNEDGIKNVGILNPKNIRSPFAKFDPAEAESADILKATGGGVHMADGGKVFKAARALLEDASKAEKPSVNRIDMNYKDVTKRVPELTEAANRLDKGEITAEDYDYLVNLYKPVKPYDFVPQPATSEDAMRALAKNKQPMFKRAHEIELGEPTDLRLDIPAYRDHGVWINSIHRKDAPTVYDTVSSVKNATMIGAPEKALKVAKGETSKSPFAVIRGEWNPTDEQAAVENAQKYLNDKDWVQVGYDPERHGYFYNRQTMEPIESAEEVIQIGPLVLAKKPKYAVKKNQKFAKGGAVEDDTDYIEEDPVAYLMNKIKPVKTAIDSPEEFSRRIGKPIPGVNPAIEMLRKGINPVIKALKEDVEKIKPRAAIDVPVNAVSEILGAPVDIANELREPVTPIRSDIVSSMKDYKLSPSEALPGSSKSFKKATTDIGLTSGEDYPALQFAAGMIGVPEAKAIGAAAKAGVKGYGNLIKEGVERNIGMFEPRMGIIKDPGGMLVGGEKALDDELRYMKKPERFNIRTTTNGVTNEVVQEEPNSVALNKWIDTKVKKYLRNQAGSEADPILKAIDSGVDYNFTPERGDTKYAVATKREQVGKPKEGIAKTDLGKEWEYKVDSIFNPTKSKDIKDILQRNEGLPPGSAADKFKASLLRMEHDLPVHSKEDLEAIKLIDQIPDENVYSLSGANITERLGLKHVGDVLLEDLQSGRLRPEQLDQMSIEKAVRRAAEYDAEKAKAMVKASAQSIEGMPTPKVYDDGFKWVELKHETDPKKTAAALKSEGEMMGHCVGSYCPQVESGRTKIYSLRSPDGKSHVTIEVNKNNHLNDWLEANKEEIDKDPLLKQMSYYDADEKYPGMYSEEEVEQAYIADITKMLKAKGAPVYEAPNSWIDIVQVKGKQNKRPDDKYQKYVSDFIKNNPTGHDITDIRELNNTNLKDIQEVIATGLTSKTTHMHPDVEKAVAKLNPHLADKFAKQGWSEEIGDAKYDLFKDIAKDFATKKQYYVDEDDILNAIREKHLKVPGKKRGGPITKKDLENQMKLDDIVDTPNLRRRYG